MNVSPSRHLPQKPGLETLIKAIVEQRTEDEVAEGCAKIEGPREDNKESLMSDGRISLETCSVSLPSLGEDAATETADAKHPPHPHEVVSSDNQSNCSELNIFEDNVAWEQLLEAFPSNEMGSIDDLFHPIPVQILASGVPVHPDDKDPDRSELTTAAELRSKKRIRSDSALKEILSSKKRRMAKSVAATRTPSSSKKKSKVIGPDSSEMKILQRMMIYLEESGEEDEWILESFRSITNKCTLRHLKEEKRHLNLPGAIFDKCIDTFGPDNFRRIYMEAKKFDHARVRELNIAVPKPPQYERPPDIVQIAVAYGIHLACTELRDKGTDLKVLIAKGSDDLAQTTNGERMKLWDYIVNGGKEDSEPQSPSRTTETES